MRLDLYVSSGRELRKAVAGNLVASGAFCVDGVVVTSPSYQVILDIETVTVGGGEVVPAPFHRLLMMHKPKGVVCERVKGSASWRRAHSSAAGKAAVEEEEEEGDSQASVYDCLPPELDHPSLGTFGRLDKDTTGLFLMGSDGGLQIMLLHPSTKFEKTYIATLDNTKDVLGDDAAERFEAGVEMSDGTRFLPAKLEIVETCCWPPRDDSNSGDNPKGPPPKEVALKVRVTCVEGQYHQVKRLLGACGGAVCALHRESIGPLRLDPAMDVGQTRPLTMDELRAIKELLPPSKREADMRRGEKGPPKQRRGGRGDGGGGRESSRRVDRRRRGDGGSGLAEEQRGMAGTAVEGTRTGAADG